MRECLQTKTGFKFVRVRPDFLKNPSTGSNLELDGFCEELNMAFEYDGEQHFHSFKHLGGHSRLQKTKDYDKMKNYMCRNNGIKLLRVSYRDISNIDALVDEFLFNNSPNEGF